MARAICLRQAYANAPQLLPKYRVVTDKWVYQAVGDALIIPQTYLEVRDAATRQVISAIELLSPANKRGEGRQQYLAKRQRILDSQTHLLEIDLLRGGVGVSLPEANRLPLGETAPSSHYCILVSASPTRPTADLYRFNLHDRIPVVPLPLAAGDPALAIDLQPLVDEVYDQLGYAYFIDYQEDPPPPWTRLDVAPFLAIAPHLP